MSLIRQSYILWSWMLVATASWLCLVPSANAEMLPFVLDETDEGTVHYWWASTSPQLNGQVDEALFSDHLTGIVSPVADSTMSISRVFQRPDLSTINAKQMASMVGASTFFIGHARKTSTHVAWLDSYAVTVNIQGALYDTRSAGIIDDIELIGYGVGASPEQAMRVASRVAAQKLARFQPGTGKHAELLTESATIEVVVQSPSRSSDVQNVREKLDAYVPQEVDVTPCRASEGEVALCLQHVNDPLGQVETLEKELRRTWPEWNIERDHLQTTRLVIRVPHTPDWMQENRPNSTPL